MKEADEDEDQSRGSYENYRLDNGRKKNVYDNKQRDTDIRLTLNEKGVSWKSDGLIERGRSLTKLHTVTKLRRVGTRWDWLWVMTQNNGMVACLFPFVPPSMVGSQQTSLFFPSRHEARKLEAYKG